MRFRTITITLTVLFSIDRSASAHAPDMSWDMVGKKIYAAFKINEKIKKSGICQGYGVVYHLKNGKVIEEPKYSKKINKDMKRQALSLIGLLESTVWNKFYGRIGNDYWLCLCLIYLPAKKNIGNTLFFLTVKSYNLTVHLLPNKHVKYNYLPTIVKIY